MDYILEWYVGNQRFRTGFSSEWLARRAAGRAWVNGGERVSIIPPLVDTPVKGRVQ